MLSHLSLAATPESLKLPVAWREPQAQKTLMPKKTYFGLAVTEVWSFYLFSLQQAPL